MSARPDHPPLLTAEDVVHYDVPHKRVELVRGRLVVRDLPGTRHGVLTSWIAMLLWNWLAEHPIGYVLAGDSGFVLERGPDTVRGPDVAVVCHRRGLPAGAPGFSEGAPDLVVEVRSPSDRRREEQDKVDQYVAAGAQLVWVVDPGRRGVWVHRRDAASTWEGDGGVLLGGDVLPGFSVAVSRVFECI